MRTIPFPGVEDVSDADDSVRFLDWSDRPGFVLECVDDLLAPHGLEIVAYETGANDHLFRIEKREPIKDIPVTEPRDELSRYAFGYSNRKPSASYWMILAGIVVFVGYKFASLG